jgi:lysophospholipase L1-like esterase
MKAQKYYQTLSYLIVCILVMALVCAGSGLALAVVKITATGGDRPEEPTIETEPPAKDTATPLPSTIMEETADFGMGYIDKMIFFGESTTAHLANRGVLTGGKETNQVWSESSGTRTLSSKITSQIISTPETVKGMTVIEACKQEQPEYMVLSFGLNGIQQFISDKQSFIAPYQNLISAIQKASPNTRIILQSVYPIAESNNTFSVDALTIDRYILTLNTWLQEIAETNDNVRYCDTASVLRNQFNALNPAYDVGDGVHLTKNAYEQILMYLRTHGWVESINE